MKLLKTYKDTKRRPSAQAGLSLIELLVFMAILTFILSFSSFLDFGFFGSYSFLSEEKKLVELLRVSRNRALNNIDQISHGLFIGSEDFVLFQGESFVEGGSTNQYFPRNKNILIENTFSGSEVVWENVTAFPSETGEFRVYDSDRETKIEINYFGRIND